MRVLQIAAVVGFVLAGLGDTLAAPTGNHAAVAEHFIRGLYGCDPSVVDELASEEITVSYPIFSKIWGTSALRGREAVRALAKNFCEHWADGEITIHDTVSEGNRVVLLWSFSGRNVGPLGGNPPTQKEHSWGGISMFRFDDEGRIIEELGEESDPGPFERLATEDVAE